VAQLNTRPLTQVALCRPADADAGYSVNMVNAPLVARERDIDVAEVKHERDCDYQTLIRLTVTTERGPRSRPARCSAATSRALVEIKGIASRPS
jgi:D-3-phosphoglycerate dehydrogenase / 2-oxoglutarate reductase